MIEACPTCLRYVYLAIQATVEYYTQYFWLMQMDLCLDLELSMENYLRTFIPELWFQ